MSYWILTEECLLECKRKWIEYYNARIDALEYLSKRSEEDYRDEGNDDIRYGRYNTRSVHEWYNGKINDLEKWVKTSISELEEENRKFEILWKQACNYSYDSRDFGYRIIYDFYRFEKRREYDSAITPGHFRVKFSGQTHWYTSKGRRKDLEFVPGKPGLEEHK